MTDSDRHLDELIRQVPLPGTLRAAVRPEAVFSDAAIDRTLRDVTVSAGLAARVQMAARTGTATRADGIVDLSRFAAAPMPAAPPPRSRRLVALIREGGSVAAALGLAAFLAAAGVEVSRRLEGPPPSGRGRIAAEQQTPAEPAGVARATGAPAPAGSDGPVRPSVVDPESGPPLVSALPPVDQPSRPQSGSLGPATAAVRPAAERSGDATVRGAPVGWSDQPGPPTMLTVPLPGGTRRAVPRAAAFDLAFEMAHGESPFVDPASDPTLAVDRPALTLRTAGFADLLAGRLGRRPAAAAGSVRVEEVLAAMPPPPAVAAGGGPVRLGLHGVRSGRASNGVPTLFVEIAAFAAGADDAARPPLEATLILDQSAAGDVRGWPAICRGLVAVASRLGPADRLSVVLCGSRPRVALRHAEPSVIMAAAASWEALPAVTAADLDAALALAAAEGLSRQPTVVVAHAVTLDRGQREVRSALGNWHRALAAEGTAPARMPTGEPQFIIVDPATPGPAADGEPTFGRTALDATAIRRELLRQVIGRETLVARQCHLEVRFDPRHVARYRLVGHRQTAVESLAAEPPPAIDLHAGETVRAVYEVVPRAAATTGLATATLTWRGLGGGTTTLTASNGDVDAGRGGLPSPHGCELLLAVGLGELVADSPHQPQPRAALAALGRLARDWRTRGDVTAFGNSLLTIVERRGPDQRSGR